MNTKYVITYRIHGTKEISKTNVKTDLLENAIKKFEAKGNKFKRENILNVKKFTHEYIPIDELSRVINS